MSIFRKDIYELTKKRNLSIDDKKKLKDMTRFSLEHFYHYRFNNYKNFDDMKYKEKFPNSFILLNECYKSI